MGFLDRLLGKQEKGQSTTGKGTEQRRSAEPGKKAAPPARTLEVDGTPLPQASDVDEFCQLAEAHRACVMVINTKDFAQVNQKVFGYFNSKFGTESRFTRAVSAAELICSRCGMEFPGSYRLNLLNPDMFAGMVGATPGHQAFGRTGQCPKCGSKQSLYVYESPLPEEILPADMEAIRSYWRHLALEWWEKQRAGRAICYWCDSPVVRDAGYLNAGHICCEACCDRLTGPTGLAALRQAPDHFGAGVLRKARQFASQR